MRRSTVKSKSTIILKSKWQPCNLRAGARSCCLLIAQQLELVSPLPELAENADIGNSFFCTVSANSRLQTFAIHGEARIILRMRSSEADEKAKMKLSIL